MKIILNYVAQLDISDVDIPKVDPSRNSIQDTVLPIVFAVTGALSVLFIVIGAFKYVISHGDPNAIESAKNTILYAIVGLIISVSAFIIVNFVLGSV